MVQPTNPKPAPGPESYNSIAAQYARAKAIKDREDKIKAFQQGGLKAKGDKKSAVEELSERKRARFLGEWGWVLGAFVWFL